MSGTGTAFEMAPRLTVKNVFVKPFLRWAGGKTWLVRDLEKWLPQTVNDYYEPFLGGGVVFLNLSGYKKAHLGDTNKKLIDTYKQIKADHQGVAKYLRDFVNTEQEYYRVREAKYSNKSRLAAQFIYLNKTSFNGIYRVNREGKYNVPYGFKNLDYTNVEVLLHCANCLKSANLQTVDFQKLLSTASKGDFVFIDPPYTVAHENNGFVGYNQKLFSIEDQARLASLLTELNKKGVKYLVTNAKHRAIKEIYQKTGDMYGVTRKSVVGGTGAKRGDFNEYIIKNY